MARYAIGDIQGCFREFMRLLDLINFNPSRDILYLVGDLVNRGPQSLEVMRWIYNNQDQVINVLGNHDIYLLARYNNLVNMDSDDSLNKILLTKYIRKYIDWLRACPLIFHDNEYILVHAGIHPLISFNQLLMLNSSISHYLTSADYAFFLKKIYGNKPNAWGERLEPIKQMKFMINSCTRMRYLHKLTYELDYKHKAGLTTAPNELIPWFKVNPHPSITKTIVFGHWAALGFYQDHQHIALDTGCVWGFKLTAINLENHELTQVTAKIN